MHLDFSEAQLAQIQKSCSLIQPSELKVYYMMGGVISESKY